MNLGLFKPKKDECDLCIGHNVGNVSDEAYAEHLLNKEEARAEKKKDKKRCSRESCASLQHGCSSRSACTIPAG